MSEPDDPQGPSALIGVKALADAAPGESNLAFTVGDHTSVPAPVNVTDT